MEAIAIVGIGCRFPGHANSPASLWTLLCNNVDAIGEVPPSRFDIDAFYDPRPSTPGKIVTRQGGFVDHVDLFDPYFFGLSPREASLMDPQQRLLLEVAWEALEDAGQIPAALAGTRTGVFVGMCYNDYEDLLFQDAPGIRAVYVTTGGFRSLGAGRLSHFFNLRGPSLAIDTACSSSLVAVHYACQSLQRGECSTALVGGSNLILEPQVSIAFSQGRMLSPDGRCKFGDSRADGFVRSEGVAVVVLKRVSEARAEGDRIYALIRGSAVNNDGRTSGSAKKPSRIGQEELLREACRDAAVSPGDIQYVEAHGTGTPVGDRAELEALGTVLAEGRAVDSPCRVGSIKTNIGHTEGAAGMAGLIKAALCLTHRTIPASLHLREPNPDISPQRALAISRSLEPWPAHPGPALAGVSSFGISATNAHVILEEAPQLADVEDDTRHPSASGAEAWAHVLPISAHNRDALDALANACRARLGDVDSAGALYDVCYAAAVRRTHAHAHRLAVVGRSTEELIERLQAYLAGEARPGLSSGKAKASPHRVVFVCSGQGSQWIGMARPLLEDPVFGPVFRDAIDRCDAAMRPYTDWSLTGELTGAVPSSLMARIDVVQPTLFAIQVALAALWRSWGVEPAAVVGHSMGEVAAAHIAGVLSLDDAARVICRRSQLLKRVSGQGAMAVVELSLEEAARAIAGFEERLSIAVSNSPTSTVLSGDRAALDIVLNRLTAQNIFCRQIKVDVASHSPQVDGLRGDLLAALDGLRPHAPSIPIDSTVVVDDGDRPLFDADYWMRNLRDPVRFWPAIQRLSEDGHDVFIELSPHPILLPEIQRGLRHIRRDAATLPSLRRDEDSRFVLLESLGALYVSGHPVEWKHQFPRAGRWITLPTYPWQRERFWLDEKPPALVQRRGHPLLGEGLRSAVQPGTHYWETALTAGTLAYLADHRVRGMVVLPATAYVEMALAAAADVFGPGSHSLESLTLVEAAILQQSAARSVQVVANEESDATATVQCFSRPAEEGGKRRAWTRHAGATIRRASLDNSRPAVALDVVAIRERCRQRRTGAEMYEALDLQDISYGPSFRAITELRQGESEALGEIRLPDSLLAEARSYQLHPALLDACFQVALATRSRQRTCVPVAVDEVHVETRDLRSGDALSVYVRHRDEGSDVTLVNESGQVLVAATGLRFQEIERQLPARPLCDLLYDTAWRPLPLPSAVAATAFGHWIIFANSGVEAATLAEQLKAGGQSAVLVHRGVAFAQRSSQSYVVDPAEAADFDRILDQPCAAVVYLWGLDALGGEGVDGASLPGDAAWVSDGARQLVQAMARRTRKDRPRLWLVSRAAQLVGSGRHALSVAQATLWGFGRVVRSERPELHCRLLDLDPVPASGESELIVREMLADDPREDEIAIRHGIRHVARLVRSATPIPASSVTLRDDATYLITGGLGALGLSVARWMVERGARHLVLVGRNVPSASAQAAIDVIRESGAEVAVRHADVADVESLRRLLDEVRRSMQPLHGVVHAAGMLRDALVERMSSGELRTVLAPKVDGAWNLHLLTQEDPLDLFVLFSSVAAWLGTEGQANYAAANAGLDALAELQRFQGRRALSIAWGPWSAIGLAAARSDRGDRLARRGLHGLTTGEALDALDRLLQMPVTRAAVMAFDGPRWREGHAAAGASMLADFSLGADGQSDDGGVSGPTVDVRAALTAAETGRQRRALLEQHVREQIAQVVRIAPSRLERDTPFGTLGLDSLMALECRNRLEASLGVTVSATIVWNYPTIAALVPYLAGEMGLPLEASIDAHYIFDDGSQAGAATSGSRIGEIADLPEHEAEALFASELAALGRYLDGQAPGEI